jgi:hypothetical protein
MADVTQPTPSSSGQKPDINKQEVLLAKRAKNVSCVYSSLHVSKGMHTHTVTCLMRCAAACSQPEAVLGRLAQTTQQQLANNSSWPTWHTPS